MICSGDGFAGLHQPSDRSDIVTAGRGEHDHRSSPLHDRLLAATTPSHDPLELPTFVVVQATHTHTFSHPPMKTDPAIKVVDATHKPEWSEH